ncbi:MAG: SRPBCC family protein [Bacteroidota bacterium]
MKHQISVAKNIQAPSGFIWETISLVGGVQHWMPGILDCRMEGRGEGAHRLCKMEDGWLREIIESIDHINRIFEYSVHEQKILPFENFRGKIKIVDQPKNNCEIIWEGKFETFPPHPTGIKNIVRQYFIQGMSGMEKLYREQSEDFLNLILAER